MRPKERRETGADDLSPKILIALGPVTQLRFG